MIPYSRFRRWSAPAFFTAFLGFFIFIASSQPAAAVIRDGGIDPANLGKGDWVYSIKDATNRLGGHISSVTNEVSLMKYYKSIGVRYLIIKMGTGATNYDGCYASPHQVTANFCNIARTNGIWIFGYTRSYGSDLAGESALADSCFNNGADGFVFDAEAEWESNKAWIGTNGPALAWQLCSMVRSNWPNKFLGHAPFPIIYLHSSFPYKEFGYWCDAVMPQIYHFSSTGIKGSASAAINWSDVNWRTWQNSLVGTSTVINGQTIYWTNSIKPLTPLQDVYGESGNAVGRCNGTTGAQPDKDVMEFTDYSAADPNCVTATGYKGINYWRSDLHGTNQFINIGLGTSGDFPGTVNNIVIDDAQATKVGAWTAVKVFAATTSAATYYGATNAAGSDTNSFGTNYWVKGLGAGSDYMQFTPTVTTAGDYTVYQWHPNRADASTNVPFVINHGGGTTTVFANQQTNSGNWSLLGKFYFALGTNGNIQVTDNFSDPAAVALVDGIKMVFTPSSIPPAPSGLTASTVSTSQVNLAWSDNSTNEAGFVIARSTVSGGPYTDVLTLGANSTMASVTNLSASTTYYFVVRAMNPLGASANSSQASATTSGFILPPTISTQPQSQTNNAGTTATFSAAASGSAPLNYQWWKNGSPLSNGGNISGATSTTLTLANVFAADAGNYSLTVTNSAGSTNSLNAALTVIDPVINTQPASRTNNLGTTATFNVVANGTALLSYQWKKNGVDMTNIGNVSGATSATLTLSSVTALDAANYTVRVSNSSSNVISTTATLTVLTAPTISSQPTSRTNIAGTTATFSVTADGAPPISYQWKKGGVSMSNGGNISGATSATLTLSTVSQTDAANYTVVVSNASGSVTSSTAALVVIDPPTIISQPQSLTNQAGTLATFSVMASGTAPLNYQWRFNGNNLAGATTNSYSRNSALTNHAGNYIVVINNSGGAVTSSIATLTVTGTVQTVTLTNIWNIPAGSRSYVTIGNTERGIALNPVSNHALIVSRSSALSGSLGIFILDSETGTELGTMSVANITNTATFKLNKIGVADDGVIYAGNLTTASSTSPLTVYRWSDEGSSPTVAYSGAPDGTARWGDSFDVRGTGTNTQIIISGSTSPTNAAIFTTMDGTNFVATKVNPSPAIAAGEFSKGLSFGSGNTFFSKNSTTNIAKQYSFNLAAGTATLTNTLTGLDTTLIAIGVDVGNNLLAGIVDDNTTNNANHRLKVYNIANPAALTVISNFNFLPIASGTNSSNVNSAGHVDTDGSRIVGLDTQNGIVALKIIYSSTPVIQSHPQSRTNIAGTIATFTVEADGAAPLSYQWKKEDQNLSNGGKVSGATTATLTLSNVSASEASNYSAVVGNAGGSVSSAVATLTVINPPLITTEPLSQTNNAGSTAIFSVAVSGSEPLVYQWKKGSANLSEGGNISGSATASLTLSGISQNDAAAYSVIITNAGGSDTSLTATLTVNDPPAITTQPTSQTVGAGSNVVFAVTATGGNLSYAWNKNNSPLGNGGNVSGATSAALTLSGVLSSDAANYSVVVANSAGSITSSPPAVLTVLNPPVILADPTSRTNNAGTTATFSVSATGTEPLSYQWRRGAFNLSDGGNVFGANSATLTLTSVFTADAADYDVVVSNGAGTATSVLATLTVIDPVITSQPSNQTNNAGTTANFTVVASGTALTYQWRKEGADLSDAGNISGATSQTLLITNLLAANAGNYTVLISGDGGSTISSNALLVVIDPILTLHPTNYTATQGTTATFSVEAYGTAPLVFQWKKDNSPLVDGGNISGATSRNLTLTGVTQPDAATYSVSVTNASGNVTSSNAVLTVQSTDFSPPSVAITSPTSNGKTNSPIITIKGTAKDTAPGVVTSVWYRLLTEPTYSQANLSTVAGIITWTSTNVTLTPGTNQVVAYAVDSGGNLSALKTNLFFYDSTSLLTVHINGNGEVKNTTNVNDGAQIPMLVGRPAFLSAFIGIGTNYVFSNWFGTVTDTNTTLNFIMQSNMVLTAQFITNPFTAAAGLYNGLFSETNVTHRTAGLFTMILSDKASYSGKLFLDGDVVSISGKFDLSGRSTKSFSRAATFGKSTLNLDLVLDWSTSSQQIFGTIGDGTWSSDLVGDRAPFSLTNLDTNFVGKYSMLIPRTNFPAASPGGFGYGWTTNNSKGQVVLKGHLGDGSVISLSLPISKNGQWPFYAPLYKNTVIYTNGLTLAVATNKSSFRGMILGWVNFINSTSSPIASVNWIKTTVPATNTWNTNYFYPAGFSNFVEIISSPYNPPLPGVRNLNFTNATVVTADGNLPGPVGWDASVTSNNVVTVVMQGTNKMTLILNTQSGVISGKFPHSNNDYKSTSFYGTVLQKQNYGSGHFPGRTDLGSTTNQTGSFIFQGN